MPGPRQFYDCISFREIILNRKCGHFIDSDDIVYAAVLAAVVAVALAVVDKRKTDCILLYASICECGLVLDS